MRPALIPAILAISLTGACSKSEPTTVGGALALRLDAQTTAALELPDGTTLPRDTTNVGSGVVVGRCVLGGATTDLELERTANGDSGVEGLAWFRMHFDSPEAPHVAHVLVDHGGELYEADCDVSSFVRSPSDGVLDVTVEACELMTPTPTGSAITTLDVDLVFAGCTDR